MSDLVLCWSCTQPVLGCSCAQGTNTDGFADEAEFVGEYVETGIQQWETRPVSPSVVFAQIGDETGHAYVAEVLSPTESAPDCDYQPAKKRKMKHITEVSHGSTEAQRERKRKILAYSPDHSGLRICSLILKKLKRHRFAWVFSEPVDPVKLELPDYFDVILSPMDLGTVETRLNSEHYERAEQFDEDVRLVFQNAVSYNPVGSDVHSMAVAMMKEFVVLCEQLRKSGLQVNKTYGLTTPSVPTSQHHTRPKSIKPGVVSPTLPRHAFATINKERDSKLLEKIERLTRSLEEMKHIDALQRQTELEQKETIAGLQTLLNERNEELRYWKSTAQVYADQLKARTSPASPIDT